MSVKDDLIKIRKIIENGWVQRYTAMDRHGSRCNPADKDAVKFCIIGAVYKGTGSYTLSEDPFHRREMIATLLRHALPKENDSLIVFNDANGRTKEDILALIDRTIEKLPVSLT